MHGKYATTVKQRQPALYLCGIEKWYYIYIYAIKHMPFLIVSCHSGSEGIHSFLMLRHRTDIPVQSSERSVGECPLSYDPCQGEIYNITQTYCYMYIHIRECAVVYLRDVRFRNAAASHRDSRTEIKA